MLLKKTFSTILSMIMSASMVTEISGSSVLTARAEETTTTASTSSVTTTAQTSSSVAKSTTTTKAVATTTAKTSTAKSATTTKATVTTTAKISTVKSTTTTKAAATTTTQTSASITKSNTETSTTANAVKTDFILGDVNDNGIVDAVDASAVLTYYAMTSTGKEGGFTESQLKAADFNNNGTVDGIDASAILSFYAKNSVGNNSSAVESETVELRSFRAEPWSVHINKEENVKFTVNIDSDNVIPENSISLFDEDGNLLSKMSDDGKNGDEKADDGIYTAVKLLSVDAPKNVNYYAAIGNEKSDDFQVVFYRDLTKDDFDGFAAINAELSDLSFDEVCIYLKNSDKIESYNVDNETRTISFRTVYCISGLWKEPSSEPNVETWESGGNDTIEDLMMFKDKQDWIYSAAEKIINQRPFQPIESSKKDIMVLRPCAYDIQNTNGEGVAYLLGKALNADVTVKKNEEVTIELLKNLSDYGTIIVESHGTIHVGREFITTGQDFRNLIDSFTGIALPLIIEPLQGELVYVDSNNKLLINGERFFNTFYRYGELDDSFWFFSSCHGMEKKQMARALVSKGADAVVGFSDEVSNGYYNEMLYEVIINNMIIFEDSLENAIAKAKLKYGEYDSWINGSTTEMRMKGDENYRFVEKKFSGNFDDDIYSMPGELYISFAPLDTGTNSDPQMLEVLEKLLGGLNESNKAGYRVYSGNTALTLGLKHNYYGSEYGTYESFDDIMLCARSIDTTFNLARAKSSSDPFYACMGLFYDYSGRKPDVEPAVFADFLYSGAKQNNKEFNILASLSVSPVYLNHFFSGNNTSNVIIIKDDYYFDNFNTNLGSDLTNSRYNGYYINNIELGTDPVNESGYYKYMNNIYYIIDLRSNYDYTLDCLCRYTSGKYIQYSEDELEKLIEFINARRFS